jgi:GntR family transcriptional regulator/MocR family aminotransferase
VRWAGGTVHAVPVDEQGLRVDALAATPARAVVVTPAHQSLTGVVLSAARRTELADWARTADDYDAELGRPVVPDE